MHKYVCALIADPPKRRTSYSTVVMVGDMLYGVHRAWR
jgi:hypothetical protein